MNINFPFHFGNLGRTAVTDESGHIRDMIEQVLFTTPGERINRPDFGSGLMQIVFSPNIDELVTTTEFTVKGALQQWLGDLIQVENVQIEQNDGVLQVAVQYIIIQNNQRQEAQFKRGGLS